MKSMISIQFYFIRPVFAHSVVQSALSSAPSSSALSSALSSAPSSPAPSSSPSSARSVVYSRRPTPIVWVSLHATIRACCHASAPDLSNSIVWVSFHATVRARCHASAPDLLSAYLARILADRIVIHGSPLLFLFFNSRPTHLNCFHIITPVFTYAPSSETSP